MSMPSKIIILYSKYSGLCKQILKLYNQMTMTHIKLLCIDHIKVRNRVLNSKEHKITTVPCLLLIYEHKQEKYEGDGIYEWIIEHMQLCLNEETKSTTTSFQTSVDVPVDTQALQPKQALQPQVLQPQVLQPTQSLQTTDNVSMLQLDDESIQSYPQSQLEDQITPFDASGMGIQSKEKKKSVKELAEEMAAERNEKNI